MKGNLQYRRNWATLVVAFIVWAMHFAVSYGAALIFPGETALVRAIVLGGTLAAAGILLARWRRLDRAGLSSLAGLSMAIAGMAIAFQALPGLLG